MKKISNETLALVNKVEKINQTIMDGGVSCLRYSEVEEMTDADKADCAIGAMIRGNMKCFIGAIM